MSTNVVSAKNIQRNWHHIDAKGKVLGRMATEVANKLSGKTKVNFVPYLDMGDYVVVTNASKVKVTGKKAAQKVYTNHSGYPGGLRQEVYSSLIKRRPEEIIRRAVKGMLPGNKLGDKMIKKLYIFSGEKHTFGKQLGVKESGESKSQEVIQNNA